MLDTQRHRSVECAPMVLHRFGTLELDVPPEWSDQSVITFVREDETKASRIKTPELKKNFVLTRAPFDGSYTLEELSRAHLAALRAQVPKIEVLREETIDVDSQPAMVREIRFPTPEHGLAQQLHVFLIRGRTAYTMVGLGSAGLAFDATRTELLAIIQSLRIK